MDTLQPIYDSIVRNTPQLARGVVFCHTCGRSEQVDAAECLRTGWPTCRGCGQTMSVDEPSRSSMEPADASAGVGRLRARV